MTSDLEILRDLIRDKALVTVEKDRYGKNFLVLKEPQKENQPEYRIEILNVPNDTIAIKADSFSSPKNIFKNTRGECKRADYIIVAQNKERDLIIYIEMKLRNAGSEKERIQQLKGAKCLVDYCRSIGQMFWGEYEFLKDYQQLYVSVKNIGVHKKPSRETKKRSLHDQPENMLKINGVPQKKLYFRELIAKS